ncbi:MAG TPA: ABC transporter ATP-binding protein [Candidatus Saccharimonadales bacterium]|nr:ABC transporter ATP-binding protein [Candidatus Saccharimonadales bacterium]
MAMHKTRVQSTDWLTVKHFWKACRRHGSQFWIALLVPISTLCISVAVPYLISRIMGSLTHHGISVSHYMYALLVFSALGVLLNYVSFDALFRLQPKVMNDLQEEALVALMKRGVSFHNNRVSGKLVSDVIDYPTSFIQLCNVLIIDILPFLSVIVLGIVLVALHSWLLGLVLFLMAVVSIGTGIILRIRMTPFRKVRHAALKDVTSHISDVIVNNTTVKTFGNETYELTKHRSLATHLQAARTHDWHKIATDGTRRNLFLLLFQIAFILVVVQEIHGNPALLGPSIFAFSYTITVSNRLFQVGTMLRTLEDSLTLAMPTTEMLGEVPEIVDTPDAKELQVDSGAIDFRDVTFRYSDASSGHDVFSNLSLDIKAGEKVGLVGPSGGGKSTLTRLLLRFEDIQGGTICIDDQNIATVTQTSVRQAIAYVPQEPLLFHRTITDNIAYGNLQATARDVQRAATQAHAHDFIMSLPNGYDTVVGERGVKLSGGQRQRVAIARAILKDAPILVLDEATSALDSESEKYIQEALWNLMQGRTAIVIAHRLSTIQRLDRIIVLDGGRVVEDGTHAALLSAGGLYASLWNHQSGGFLEE